MHLSKKLQIAYTAIEFENVANCPNSLPPILNAADWPLSNIVSLEKCYRIKLPFVILGTPQNFTPCPPFSKERQRIAQVPIPHTAQRIQKNEINQSERRAPPPPIQTSLLCYLHYSSSCYK